MTGTFRAGVGAVILDSKGRVLALERASRPGAWQLPQGGIDVDEQPIDALWREVREETGLTQADLTLIGEVAEWLGYELPPEARSEKTGWGQVHKWFLLRTTTDRPPIALHGPAGEFRSWQWLDMRVLVEGAVAFRRPVYRRLAEVFEQQLSR